MLRFRFVDPELIRLWARAMCNTTVGRVHPSSDVVPVRLQMFLNSLTSDSEENDEEVISRDEIVSTLLQFRFVAPKLKFHDRLLLKSVVFRRQSGIGKGFTLSAARLEALWGDKPADRTHSTGVRVLENSRHCGMYNAPIVKHESEVVRTRASKVQQRVDKARRARRRLEEKAQLHKFIEEGIKTKKLLSDGFWCRLSGN